MRYSARPGNSGCNAPDDIEKVVCIIVLVGRYNDCRQLGYLVWLLGYCVCWSRKWCREAFRDRSQVKRQPAAQGALFMFSCYGFMTNNQSTAQLRLPNPLHHMYRPHQNLNPSLLLPSLWRRQAVQGSHLCGARFCLRVVHRHSLSRHIRLHSHPSSLDATLPA